MVVFWIFVKLLLYFVVVIICLFVGIVVYNKILEEYWFFIKFKLFYVGGDVEIISMKMLIEYFLV